eukprot:10540067-Prorocentrum_lima.AAC.1
MVQPEDQSVRREDLYLSKTSHGAVEKSRQHGISTLASGGWNGNLASGGLKSVPVSGVEGADSKG